MTNAYRRSRAFNMEHYTWHDKCGIA